MFVCFISKILSFCFLLMRCLGGRIDRAYERKKDNRSTGAGQEGEDFNEVIERTC